MEEKRFITLIKFAYWISLFSIPIITLVFLYFTLMNRDVLDMAWALLLMVMWFAFVIEHGILLIYLHYIYLSKDIIYATTDTGETILLRVHEFYDFVDATEKDVSERCSEYILFLMEKDTNENALRIGYFNKEMLSIANERLQSELEKHFK